MITMIGLTYLTNTIIKINEFNDDDQNINPSYNNDSKHDYMNDVLFAMHYSYISN